jgi:hypothetical protein
MRTSGIGLELMLPGVDRPSWRLPNAVTLGVAALSVAIDVQKSIALS